MFRSSTLSTKKKKSKNVAGSSNALDLITLVPGIEDNEGCAQSSNPALIESIESISECYQFAIRHKPPLGPLRAVEDHIPSLPDELVVRKANSLYVVGEFADGWVLAINASYNNACGMIPRRCLFFPVAPFMTKEAVEASAPPSTKSDSSFPIPDSKADLQN
ncbi:hypothetical protein GGI12_003580 [Dipsacomyces acuminosporus]|nr:hypothetical protein GGI12_003580 [Dipsacomyces acuminosporus]